MNDNEFEIEKEKIINKLDEDIKMQQELLDALEQWEDEQDKNLELLGYLSGEPICLAKNQDFEKVSILEKYSDDLLKSNESSCNFYIGRGLPKKQLKNAISSLDKSIDIDTVIGLYDTTLWNSGKRGYIFTNEAVYYKELIGRTKSFSYREVEHIKIISKDGKEIDELHFVLSNGKTITMTDTFIDKLAFKQCVEELAKISKKSLKYVDTNPSEKEAEVKEEKSSKAAAVGKFLKNAVIDLGGSAINLSNADIEKLKKDNVTEFVADLFGAVSDRSAEIAEKQAERETKIEQAKKNRTLLMTQEYRKAFKKRGLDYDKL